jgi:hypothetical protein
MSGFDPRRERLRLAIAKHWKSTGRRTWTSDEIEQAIDAAMAKRQPAAAAAAGGGSAPAEQLDLLDHGCHAGQTRAESARQAAPHGHARRDAMERHIVTAGSHGATRDELAIALDLPVQSITGPVSELLAAGRIKENGRKRPTRYGRPAAVLISSLLPTKSTNENAPNPEHTVE